MTPRPYTVDVPQHVLDDLQARLSRTRWPDEPADLGWSSGTNTQRLRELVLHWQQGYDWRAQERALNAWPQFIATLGGTRIHYVHCRSIVPGARPLLLLHGWPDSVVRYLRVIGPLTDPLAHGGSEADAFDVIVPSLPGFGFSDPRPMSSSATADVLARLMTECLGHDRYFVAGGDVGSLVAMAMASRPSSPVLGMHLTDCGYPTGQEDPSTLTESEREFARFIQGWWMTQGAYAMVHATKPHTLAHALTDSPVGLAAWMLSFIDSGALDHDVEQAVGGRDALLTMIMVQWVGGNIGPAMRSYQLEAEQRDTPAATTAVAQQPPAAVTVYPREAPTPEDWARRKVNLVRFANAEAGGHFPSMEVPQAYVADLRSALRALSAATPP